MSKPLTDEELKALYLQLQSGSAPQQPSAVQKTASTEIPDELQDLSFVDRTKTSKQKGNVLASMEGTGYGTWAVLGRLNDCVIGKHKSILVVSGDNITVSCSLCNAKLADVSASAVNYSNPAIAQSIITAKNKQNNAMYTIYRTLIAQAYFTQRLRDKLDNYVSNLTRNGQKAAADAVLTAVGLTEKGFAQLRTVKDLPVSSDDVNNQLLKDKPRGGWFTLTK